MLTCCSVDILSIIWACLGLWAVARWLEDSGVRPSQLVVPTPRAFRDSPCGRWWWFLDVHFLIRVFILGKPSLHHNQARHSYCFYKRKINYKLEVTNDIGVFFFIYSIAKIGKLYFYNVNHFNFIILILLVPNFIVLGGTYIRTLGNQLTMYMNSVLYLYPK